MLALAVVGAWLGILLGGRASVDVGPVETTMSLQPSLGGNTVLAIAPLGTVEFNSHDGPLGLRVTIDAINAADAREIFDDPQILSRVQAEIVADVRSGVTNLLIRGLVAGAVGGLALGLLALRPRRHGWASGGLAALAVGASAVTGIVTLQANSIVEPHYTGLLTNAPAVVGDAQTIAANVDNYRNGLASLVANVSALYDVTSTLESYSPNGDVTRVLHISDLHVNPTAWPIIRSVVDQFSVDVVVDTGDIVHQGTAFESAYVRDISTVGVPYVFVRGNHDSSATILAVEAEPNAIVLDGTIAEVEGIRFLGIADPRFTPDKARADENDDVEVERAQEVVDALGGPENAAETGIDIALMHNPVGARVLDGMAPYILTGHMHSRAREVLPSGSYLFQQGSTGASGPNALKSEEPTPITLTVLYLDAETQELQAWDDITLGGLGLASAEIERHLASSFAGSADAGEVPDPVATETDEEPTDGSTPGEDLEGTPGTPLDTPLDPPTETPFTATPTGTAAGRRAGRSTPDLGTGGP